MYSIIRTKKHKTLNSLKAREAHTFRTRPTPNADTSKQHKNKLLFGQNNFAEGFEKKLKEYEAAGNKIRSDAVLAIEYLLTASPEFFEQGNIFEQEKRLEKWCASQIDYLKEVHGAENIVCAYLHLDEKTPHIEAYVLPIDPKKKLNCKHFLGGREKLAKLQTEYAKHNISFGLQRGMERSIATHQDVKKFYGMISQATTITNERVLEAIKLDEPGILDKFKLSDWLAGQQKQITKRVFELFKGTVYENKLLPAAKKLMAEWKRKEKALKDETEKQKYEFDKQLLKMKTQIEEQLSQLIFVEGLKAENEDVKKQNVYLQTENAELKKKLGSSQKLVLEG